MLLNPSPVPREQFSISHAYRRLVAEASALGGRPGEVLGGRLYDDAADVGITVTNPAGNTHWYLTQDDIVMDGELQGWIYRPCAETVRRWPRLAGWEVHILND